ncbi:MULTISPECIES: tyrosine-type recombinase/integrase [Streptomyces]|uniref:tyrosine-type recombinase/integrase n=1 Tax=Streptomyces TaxID=1883 RepID=UPI00143E92E0|nr:MULTISPECIES: tyrosine-type recombinase/integrase [Streptomyces]QIY58018.1 phage integrase family protein [Streptomyces sp. RPA4-5]WSW55031.1 site-specific integrase [Streptomyces platensis]WSX23343.1 site-specific integrase [Streptomyces tubercidicus]
MSVEVMEEEWLYSEEQVRALLEWVRGQEGVERSVYPFVCLVAEQALRPGEARGLRVSDVDVPVHGWGKLTVGSSRTAREVPLKPRLVELLREWISEAGLREKDLLFPGRGGHSLSASHYQRVWERAQEAVLPRDERYSWRLGEPISILRETCLVNWLQAGVSCIAVAELAGVTPSWLAMRYPYCFRVGEAVIDWDQLAELMALPESPKS